MRERKGKKEHQKNKKRELKIQAIKNDGFVVNR